MTRKRTKKILPANISQCVFIFLVYIKHSKYSVSQHPEKNNNNNKEIILKIIHHPISIEIAI